MFRFMQFLQAVGIGAVVFASSCSVKKYLRRVSSVSASANFAKVPKAFGKIDRTDNIQKLFFKSCAFIFLNFWVNISILIRNQAFIIRIFGFFCQKQITVGKEFFAAALDNALAKH